MSKNLKNNYGFLTVFTFLRYLYKNTNIMGRKKKEDKDKKVTVSIRIPDELLASIADIENKSQFFEWLLEEYFAKIKMK